MVDDILLGRISVKEDSLWENSGADNLDEYERWAKNICGMTCVKMVLKKELGIEIPLVKTAKESVRYGCYKPVKGNDDIPGLFYDPILGFLKNEFGVDASVFRRINLRRIKSFVEQGHYVIISVNPEIRDINKPITRKAGGHLVLVTGFDEDRKTITIHNPSGYYEQSQKNYSLPQDTFQKYFAQRGFVMFSRG